MICKTKLLHNLIELRDRLREQASLKKYEQKLLGVTERKIENILNPKPKTKRKSKPRVIKPLKQLHCPVCDNGFEIPHSKYVQRRAATKSEHIYCSQVCTGRAVAKRRKR